jgi:hypothetical protein
MEEMNKREAEEVLQFIEDKGLSFEKVSTPDGDQMVNVYAITALGHKIHYAIYPMRNALDSADRPPRRGYIREAVEFVMDMEEGL